MIQPVTMGAEYHVHAPTQAGIASKKRVDILPHQIAVPIQFKAGGSLPVQTALSLDLLRWDDVLIAP